MLKKEKIGQALARVAAEGERIHVIPRKRGYAIIRQSKSRAYRVRINKDFAIAEAFFLAEKYKINKILIHEKDGSIETTWERLKSDDIIEGSIGFCRPAIVEYGNVGKGVFGWYVKTCDPIEFHVLSPGEVVSEAALIALEAGAREIIYYSEDGKRLTMWKIR